MRNENTGCSKNTGGSYTRVAHLLLLKITLLNFKGLLSFALLF